ncbi:MAG: Ger(x)C family spore germination C-terminal domain-containing protein [Christensenellaceae bacterium]|jgi:hypothetical protein|nr:Ger(x)C family spore germination C-terminal domain-containing protein [Christensenellaceae bacterium]
MFRILWQKKALILFLAVLIALFPSAASRPAQMLSKAVLTEITIDKTNGEYTLSGEMIQIEPSNETPAKKTVPVTASGVSVGECINKIADAQNKQVSFSHCSNIILGAGLEGENVAEILRYFLYKTELSNKCTLSWQEKGNRTSLERFFKDWLRPASAGVMSKGSHETAVFKDGKFAFTLDEIQTDAFDFLMGARIKKRLTTGNEVLHIVSNMSKIKGNNIHVKIKAELESDPHADAQKRQLIAKTLEEKLKSNINSMLEMLYPNYDVLNIGIKNSNFNTKVDITVIT